MKPIASCPTLVKRLLLSAILAAPLAAVAQHPVARLSGELAAQDRSALPGSVSPRAQAQYATGRLPGSTQLGAMSIVFSRTQAQELALKTLIAAQQNPASGQYHKWLTPDQFAARFGMADADLAKVQNWLTSEGFAVEAVGRSKNLIRFSGTASQAEQAFKTELNSYSIPTGHEKETHFAASTALSVPSSLAGVTLSIRGLDDFRPHTHLTSHRKGLEPRYTLNQNGQYELFFDPGDVHTIYDIKSGSYTGTGQTITVIGQSAIQTADLDAFWNAASISRQDPSIALVSGTGTSKVYADGDEAESDLDLEWSGAIAPGAALNFVYSGTNGNAFDAIEFAVDNLIGTIISSSYGDCETDIGQASLASLDSFLEQATSQGQTVLSAAGDAGATDCIADTNLTTAQQQALAVDYPASSAYVLAVGGTEISQAQASYETPGDGYWEALSNTSSVQTSSVQQYIPEQAWNESAGFCSPGSNTAAEAICGGGGGASAFFAKPAWQTGVSGIPADSKRDVPDVALNAAIYNPGYLFCTSDQTFWDTADGQASSCTSGYLDSTQAFATAGGGTSFATPIFAGMIALINQQQGYTSGQGLVNSTLYTLAANSGTYSSAFHDITVGDNGCDITTWCGSTNTGKFAAGTGYDQATGLGSVDLDKLLSAWPAASGGAGTVIGTTTTIAAASTAPALNTNDAFTITVTPASGSITLGTLSITVDGGTAVPATLTANGTYVYTTSFTTTGTHTIIAKYAGDSTFAASTGTITVNVPTTSSGKGTIALAATPATLTVSQGSQGNEAIAITPAGGYTGTVLLNFDTSNDNALENLCYDFTDTDSSGNGEVSVSGTTAVTTQLTLDANASDCASANAIARTHKHAFRNLKAKSAASHQPASPFSNTGKPLAAGIALAGLVLFGFARRGSRTLRNIAAILLVAAAGLFTTACSNSVDTNTLSNPSKGTYTVTVQGQDSATSTITATTTFTFVID